MEIFQDGAFPNLEYHLFQVSWLVSALMRLSTCDKWYFFVETDIFILGFSIFVHILLDFMEIFQDGAFSNLEYHLFQVIWSVFALIR